MLLPAERGAIMRVHAVVCAAEENREAGLVFDRDSNAEVLEETRRLRARGGDVEDGVETERLNAPMEKV